MTQKNFSPLGARLSTAVRYVREGAFLADIGTDHAYLPIHLCRIGRIRGAVAADIARGPLAIAARHIKEEGLADDIAVCLSDGLDNIEPYHPTDIAVFGMGGELIADIIGRAAWTKDPSVRLILQPMTKQTELRAFLAQNGYRIIDECLSEDGGRLYQTLCAEYDGTRRAFSPLALLVGEKNLAAGGALLSALLDKEALVLRKIVSGKSQSGADSAAELGLLKEIEEYRKEHSL